MKFLNLSFVALSSVIVMSSAFANCPLDLEDLKHQYQSVEKTEQAKFFIGLEDSTVQENEDMFQRTKKELEELGEKDKKIATFQFVKLTEDSRDFLLKSLFPTGETDRAFCASFPAPKPKTKLLKESTEEERLAKLVKAKFKACRTSVKDILGGTIHANPIVYLAELGYEDETGIALFYVNSLVDKTHFVRYHFKY